MEVQGIDRGLSEERNSNERVPRTGDMEFPRKPRQTIASSHPSERPTVTTDTTRAAEGELLQFAPGSAGGRRDTGDEPHSPSRWFGREIGRVLAVDDQVDALKSIGRYFRKIGVSELFTATNADDALKLARDEVPDLAVVDIFLTSGDVRSGLDLIAALRAQNPRLVIGAMSAAMNVQLATESRAAGAAWCLEKPFTAATLVGTIVMHSPPPDILRVDMPFETLKQVYTERVVKAKGGSKSAAARVMGMQRSTVQRVLKRGPKRDG